MGTRKKVMMDLDHKECDGILVVSAVVGVLEQCTILYYLTYQVRR